MSALTARSVAIADQILAALADTGGLPISTTALLEKISPRPATVAERLAEVRSGHPVMHGELLRLLNRLAKRGEVEKWEPLGVMLSGSRCCYWRLLATVEPQQ